MSAKVKTKKIKIPAGIKDENLAEMFNQMLGAGTINVAIAYPRYRRIRILCEQIVKLFGLVTQSPFMRGSEFSQQKAQIETFCTSATLSIEKMFDVDFTDYEWNLDLVEDNLKQQFAKSYEGVKKSDLVNTFIIMCDRLIRYRKNFTDLANLTHGFALTLPGMEWCPFPFTNLNMKVLLCGEKNIVSFFMIVLNKAYELSKKLYDETQSPDIDVDQFVDVIMVNIDEIQKRPELSRCRKAFQKIRDSVRMLKTNFSEYYKDFIQTGDGTIIMQHFIIDVSKNTDADPQTTNQFRKIITYYKKIAQDQITNPKIKLLFDKVSESFKDLERGTENLVGVKAEDESEDDSEGTTSIGTDHLPRTMDDV